MAKMRVHELAKELDIKSADIVKALGEKGIDVKATVSYTHLPFQDIRN